MTTRVAEPLAAVATGILFIACTQGLELHGPFVLAAIGGWTVWLVVRVRRDRAVLSRWGLTARNLRPAAAAATAFAVAGIAGMAGIAHARGTLAIPPHLLPVLALYPVWGLVQQLLVQGMVAANLDDAGVPAAGIVPICAALFALVHVPDWPLVGATFLLGAAFTPMWLRWRNLWPLGVWHGWLGGLFYFWVLARDPWAQVLGG